MNIFWVQKRAADHWDAEVTKRSDLRLRWWDSPRLVELVTRRFIETTGGMYNAQTFIQKVTGRDRYRRAISVGCGTAQQELSLLQTGFVDHFTLCDISPEMLRLAQQSMEAMGIDAHRVTFRSDLQIGSRFPHKVDLVFWRHALHHMLDVDVAIAWSVDQLWGEGAIYCDDYCGPDRVQYTPEMIAWAERIRGTLPERLRRNPHAPQELLDNRPVIPSAADWEALDPTECADSSRIIPSLKARLPNTTFAWLGGVMYSLALNDIIHNFGPDDDHVLELIMTVDGLLADQGMNLCFACVSVV